MIAAGMCVASLAGAAAARADWGIVDPYLSTVWFSTPFSPPATLLVVPDGSGPGFTAARTINRQIVDATVIARAINDMGLAETSLQREEWSLVWRGGNVVACANGLAPDHDTLADGTTAWSTPPRAGGQSQALVRPAWLGQQLLSTAGLALQVNSPDLNGDLVVDLLDVARFAQDFGSGVYQFRSDLSYDGVVNLSDIIPMVQHYGARCP
jgi:hypothetical protein